MISRSPIRVTFVKRVVFTVALLLLVGFGGWIAVRAGVSWFGDKTAAGDTTPATPQERQIIALGRLEPSGGIVPVAALTGDRLQSLDVAKGDQVVRDQPIGTLDSQLLRQLDLQSIEARIRETEARRVAEQRAADAQIAAAQLAVQQADSTQIEIESQEKQIDLLKANLALEEKNKARLDKLSAKLVSDQEKERQALVVQKSEAELGAAEATLAKMKQASEFKLALARADLQAALAAKEKIASATPVESLGKTRDAAREQLARTTLVAPVSGTVLKVHTRAGELIANKPILQIADLSRMVCVAEVYETDVKRIQVGQRAMIHSNAFARPADKAGLRGRVVWIDNMIGTPELTSLDPFARADRRVIPVRIELDSASVREAAKFVNLQVDVTILPAASR